MSQIISRNKCPPFCFLTPAFIYMKWQKISESTLQEDTEYVLDKEDLDTWWSLLLQGCKMSRMHSDFQRWLLKHHWWWVPISRTVRGPLSVAWGLQEVPWRFSVGPWLRVKLKHYLPLSLSVSECQWNFPETTWCVPTSSLWQLMECVLCIPLWCSSVAEVYGMKQCIFRD